MTDTKTAATAGPWHNASTNFGYGPCHVCGPKHADGGDYAPICIADTEANAKLIAAAPELLDALRSLRTELRAVVKLDVKKHYSLMVADVAADKAIAKAEGRG